MFSTIFSKSRQAKIPWVELSNIHQLKELDRESETKPVLIFKHSTRCPISATALDRLERSYDGQASFQPYFLDLIAHRDISNAIADHYKIKHESPQTLLIKDGKVIFHSSHMAINYHEIHEHAQGV